MKSPDLGSGPSAKCAWSTIWSVPLFGGDPMDSRSQLAFLLLMLAQAAHSIEEYTTELYEVFALARFVSGLVSDDLATGFVVLNASLVAFGLWCYAVPVRSDWPSARGWAWAWVLLELGNGISHSAFALYRGGYFPGAATAPVLLALAAWLAVLLVASRRADATRRDP